MRNHFAGFRLFVEAEGEEDKDSFLAHTKKTFGVAKKLWLGMPLLLSNVKLGEYRVKEPTMFYVKDFDDTSVTLTNVMNPMTDDPGSDDPDDEIDLDDSGVDGQAEITISREDFEDLQKPQTFQGMDTMSLRPGGGMM